MAEEIKKRRQLSFEFLGLLYQKSVGENDRSKLVSTAEVARDLGLYEPPANHEELSPSEMDQYHEQGLVTSEIVKRLSDEGYIKLYGHPNPYYEGSIAITREGINEVEDALLGEELSDNELRGFVLQKYYMMRHEDYIPINEATFGTTISLSDVFRISEQLHEHGLIDFDPLRGDDKIISAFGKITAPGIDVVEQKGKSAPIQITFINQTINMSGSRAEEEILQILNLLKEKADTEETLLQKANTIIQLQPNFAGIGINLNEIVNRLLKGRK